jgi:organic radical activating enzyme
MEAFYTLQGEGFHQGKAAYFVRLGGCDVGCFWCDVKESWDVLNHPQKTAKQIIEEAKAEIHRYLPVPGQSQASKICVVTGGEPLMHDLSQLTATLQQHGFQTHLETSGAYLLSGSWDWICLSPKKFKPPLPQNFQKANELKMVIYNKSDFKWAELNAANVSPGCQLYLQPEWSKCDTITPLIVDYIKAHPQWQFSLQIHKYIHVP